MAELKRPSLPIVIVSWLFLTLNIFTTAFPSTSAGPIPLPYLDIVGRTHIEKLGVPVNITAGQIPVGKAWDFTCLLESTKVYHIYCYGKWITSKTDYDIYVFGPDKSLVGWHTEARGLPEHLGDNVNYPFFTPKRTGTYTFTVHNDYPESNGTDPATFMVIEHIQTDKWHNLQLEGKDRNDTPVYRTSWALEFNTESPEGRIEVLVNVPNTLDMYEVRLILMAYPDGGYGEYLANAPIAWEPGLYGNIWLEDQLIDSTRAGNLTTAYPTGIGGYNMNDTLNLRGYRGNNFSSCEYPGQGMSFNFTVPYKGNLLYHLVFIAERGKGTLSFITNTDFTPPTIHNVSRSLPKPNPNQEVEITANVTDYSGVDQVLLNYFYGSLWINTTMAQRGEVYVATIPALPLGTDVLYQVYARDRVGHWAKSTIQSYRVYSVVVIDNSFVSDERCNLGTKQTVRLHAVWKHDSTDIVGGHIFVDGTKYTTDETGWISFETVSSAVGKRTWTVTGVNCFGMTDYETKIKNPTIIWDRIKITGGGASSKQVEINQRATIWFTAVYEYDNTVFDGSKGMLYVGGSPTSWSPTSRRWELVHTFTTKGTRSFTFSHVSDDLYGITMFIDMAGSQVVECIVPTEKFFEQWWVWAIIGGAASLVVFFVGGTLFYRLRSRRRSR